MELTDHTREQHPKKLGRNRNIMDVWWACGLATQKQHAGGYPTTVYTTSAMASYFNVEASQV